MGGGLEIREFIGVIGGGLIFLALIATAVNGNNKTADVATAFANGFANDIRASTFQNAPSGG